MKKLRFIDQGLAGDIFYPDAPARPTSAGIFLFGFPAFIGPNAVTHTLVRHDLLAFQPHYFGTYDSDRTFSPQNTTETCSLAQRLFERGYVTKVKDGGHFLLPPQLDICIGHSFGTLAALRAISELSTAKILVLFAPTVRYGRHEPDLGVTEDGVKHFRYVQHANPYTYRFAPNAEWEELLHGREPWPMPLDHPSLQEVIAVVGEHDHYLDIPALEKNLPKIIRAYCGERAAFSLRVIPGAGHNLDDLVEAGEHFSLAATLTRAGFGSA